MIRNYYSNLENEEFWTYNTCSKPKMFSKKLKVFKMFSKKLKMLMA